MAGSVNRVILLGNLGRDPEIRSTQDGTKIANLSVATSESWKDKNTGERREKSEWHRVCIFGPLAEIAEKYLRKGSKVYLEGALQTRMWQDQSGQDKYSTEVVLQQYRGELVMLDSKPQDGGQDQRQPDAEHQRPLGDQRPRQPESDLGDEIPFAPLRDLP